MENQIIALDIDPVKASDEELISSLAQLYQGLGGEDPCRELRIRLRTSFGEKPIIGAFYDQGPHDGVLVGALTLFVRNMRTKNMCWVEIGDMRISPDLVEEETKMSRDMLIEETLVEAACELARSKEARYVRFYCSEMSREMSRILKKMGFEYTDRYVLNLDLMAH